jgi:FkbM family methyltransferase
VAVEADARNIACIRRNFANYRKYLDGSVQLCEGAVWDADGELAFSSEGNMGSSAANIVGGNRGVVGTVRSFTLESIARRFALTRVDFIKCDIEGAERTIFGDREFFARFSPRIIIEPHVLGGVATTAACISALETHGYVCETIVQHGVPLPLIQCAPARRSNRSTHP